ncbi:peptidase S24/S26A/S26B/S26C [Blastocladiella britannica]|nr:peptidase S24/S26A/S26B/S26C [Blastocladiella britannica]
MAAAAFAARHPLLKAAADNLLFLAKIGAFVHVFNSYVAEVTMCMGPSMLPTFNMMGDFVLIDKATPRLWPVTLGDVVVATSLTSPDRIVCKRITGMENDLICVDPSVPINQREYLRVPRGHVWLSGDNMSNSTDSRNYGPVPMALVKGKVTARIWPEPKWIVNGIEQAKLERMVQQRELEEASRRP